MATYTELDSLFNINESSGLRRRVAIATLIASDKIRLEADDGTSATVRGRKRFSQRINNQLLNEALFHRGDDSPWAFHPIFESVYRAVVIQNRSATLTQIQGASDVAVQTAVDAAITHLAAGYPDPVVPDPLP